MKPTKQLIRGLRETAAKLRSADANYDWVVSERCNCGQLAQTLLDKTPEALNELLRRHDVIGAWTRNARQYCRSTGLPSNIVFRALAEAGMEPGDYFRLEFLEHGPKANRHVVASWMDAEADKLEARRAAGERPERGAP